jgi:hypothetical protein
LQLAVPHRNSGLPDVGMLTNKKERVVLRICSECGNQNSRDFQVDIIYFYLSDGTLQDLDVLSGYKAITGDIFKAS